MEDINTALSKHFAGEASKEEDVQAQAFKREQPQEYEVLKSLWRKNEIDLFKPDADQAWQTIVKKSTQGKTRRIIPMRRIASIAAAFLLGMMALYHFYLQPNSGEAIHHIAHVQNEKVELEDGSVVYLTNNAQLSYPTAFASRKREITIEGEAFFDIARDENRPFIIHTGTSDIEVLGTSFTVDADAQRTLVSVASGKVQVSDIDEKESVVLVANESAQATAQGVNKVEIDANFMAWQSGLFTFDQAPLELVISELNTYYDDRIILSQTDADCQLSTSFNRLEIAEVMEIIQLSCSLELTQTDGIYELH